MDTLSNIFGNTAKVKLLRLFLFNDNVVLDEDDIAERADINKRLIKKELIPLIKMGCIKSKQFSKEVIKKPTATKKSKGNKKGSNNAKKDVVVIKKFTGWTYDQNFLYGESLRHLFSLATVSTHDDLSKKASIVGRVKFMVVSGVFIQNEDSRVDMLIVGDGLNAKKLENLIKDLEAEIGREVKYSMFETTDFLYRLGLYDKLIRDILDFPHKTLINKLGIEA